MKKIIKKKSSIDYQKQINEILEEFDFDYVHEFMLQDTAIRVYDDYGNVTNTSQWRIYLHGDLVIPDIQDLKDVAKDLLERVSHNSAFNKGFYYIHTGPFRAECINGELSLLFVAKSWECEV